MLRNLWREVKVKFWYEVFVCSPKRCELSTRGYQSPMRVVDQSSLRRLAILRLPGLPASRDFPDDQRWPRTRFLGFVQGAQICMAPGERDMIAASPDWCTCNSQCLHAATRAPQPALSVTILAGRSAGNFSLVGPGLTYP